jgi:hypothetical protein
LVLFSWCYPFLVFGFCFFDVEFLFPFSCSCLVVWHLIRLPAQGCHSLVTFLCYGKSMSNWIMVMVWLSFNDRFCFLWLYIWNFYMVFMFTSVCYM